jgi:hypothetical protein
MGFTFVDDELFRLPESLGREERGAMSRPDASQVTEAPGQVHQQLVELSLAVHVEAKAIRVCVLVVAGVTMLVCWLM